MIKICPICEELLEDGDDVVAIMVTKFRMIPSAVNFAIEQPTRCIEITHNECFDWDDLPEEEIEA